MNAAVVLFDRDDGDADPDAGGREPTALEVELERARDIECAATELVRALDALPAELRVVLRVSGVGPGWTATREALLAAEVAL